ncbi:MAG: Bax inhibitor-1 family protein [Opitutales bacterium]
MNPAHHQVFTLAEAPTDVRATFIRRTYAHLAGAVLTFVLIEAALFSTGIAYTIADAIFSWGNIGWLGVLGAFVIGGWLASSMAHKAESKGQQYAGLGIYIVLEALIFVPLLAIAMHVAGSPELIYQAGLITGGLFLGLTAVVFTTKTDFSYLGGILKIGFLIAIGLIVAGVIFGFNLGLWFSVAMVALAGGAILYTTSKILHNYNEDQYVGASLELFAAVALLFWYVLRILIALSGRD